MWRDGKDGSSWTLRMRLLAAQAMRLWAVQAGRRSREITGDHAEVTGDHAERLSRTRR